MTDEPPTWTPPPLDAYDCAAIQGLLARVMRIDIANKADQAIVAQHNKAITERNLERAKHITGIGGFGFDMAGDQVWARVRLGIGDKAYIEASQAAQQPIKPINIAEIAVNKVAEDETHPDLDSEDGPEEAEGDVPKIREAILSYLRSLPAEKGAQVPTIKEYLAESFKIETHEKTPGMTLYRLSKDGLVRRDGRTWFAVTKSNIEPETSQ